MIIDFLNSVSSGYTSNNDNVLTTFISAGQSNMDGRNDLTSAPIWIDQNNPIIQNLKMWNVNNNQFDTFKIGVNTGGNINTSLYWGMDLTFYKLYSDYINKIIYSIKRSSGGSAIYNVPDVANEKGCWNVDFDNIPAGTPKLLQELETRFNDATSYVTNFGKSLSVKAIIWYQGSSDVSLGPTAIAAYKENFRNVINYIRNTIVKDPLVPFIFGPQSHNSLTHDIPTMETGQIELLSEMSNLYYVDSTNLTMLPDQIHIDAVSSIWYGTNVFDQLKNIIIP